MVRTWSAPPCASTARRRIPSWCPTRLLCCKWMSDENFQAQYASSILVTRSQETPANSGVPAETDSEWSAVWSASPRKLGPLDRAIASPPTKWMLFVAVVVCIVLMIRAVPARAAEASCYGPGLWGNHTANGQTLNRGTLGIAHKTLPLGTRLRLHANNRTITVVVIDRGPFVAGRSIDITQASVTQLGVSDCTQWGHRTVRTWLAR